MNGFIGCLSLVFTTFSPLHPIHCALLIQQKGFLLMIFTSIGPLNLFSSLSCLNSRFLRPPPSSAASELASKSTFSCSSVNLGLQATVVQNLEKLQISAQSFHLSCHCYCTFLSIHIHPAPAQWSGIQISS